MISKIKRNVKNEAMRPHTQYYHSQPTQHKIWASYYQEEKDNHYSGLCQEIDIIYSFENVSALFQQI